MLYNFFQIIQRILSAISFYPFVGILIGAGILNIQNGAALSIQVVLYYLWVTIMLPFWAMGQHWVFLLFPAALGIPLQPLDHLLGLHIIFVSLLLLVVLIILKIPQYIFAFYLVNAGSKSDLFQVKDLAKKYFWQTILRVITLAALGIITPAILLVTMSFLLPKFMSLYSPAYIAWAYFLRIAIITMSSFGTTILSMKILYQFCLRKYKL